MCMHYFISLILMFSSLSIMGQTPEEVVQRQLDTYNARDLDGFIAVFSADAQLIDFASGEIRAQGKEALKETYGRLFKSSPDLHSELLNRIVMGTKVIDHEKITGRQGAAEPLELIMIYEVEDGKIVRATAVRP